MVLPDALLERFENMFSFYSCPVPAFEQHTLARFMNEGYFSKHLQRLKTSYRAKRNSAIEVIEKSALFLRSEISAQDFGLHFLLKLKTERDDAAIKGEALSKGIKLSFLSDFAYSKNPKFDHTLIISYSDLDLENLKKALSELNGIIFG